jgi:hypothetical protein
VVIVVKKKLVGIVTTGSRQSVDSRKREWER